MPKLLYKTSDQLANVVGVPNAGVDNVPGNIIKVVFVDLAGWKSYATPATETNIKTAAWWLAYLATTDRSHVVTGFIDAFDIPPTTPIKEGGNDNSTWNGVPRTKSISHTTAKGKICGITQAEADKIRQFGAKSGNYQQGARVGVLLLHEENGMTALADAKPIPIFNVFLGDPKQGGLGQSDDYEFEFDMEGGWSFKKKIYELGFEGASLANAA